MNAISLTRSLGPGLTVLLSCNHTRQLHSTTSVLNKSKPTVADGACKRQHQNFERTRRDHVAAKENLASVRGKYIIQYASGIFRTIKKHRTKYFILR